MKLIVKFPQKSAFCIEKKSKVRSSYIIVVATLCGETRVLTCSEVKFKSTYDVISGNVVTLTKFYTKVCLISCHLYLYIIIGTITAKLNSKEN